MVNSFVSLVFIKLPMDYSEEAYQHPNQIKLQTNLKCKRDNIDAQPRIYTQIPYNTFMNCDGNCRSEWINIVYFIAMLSHHIFEVITCPAPSHYLNNADLLPIGPIGTNVNAIQIAIHKFPLMKMPRKMVSAKWCPFSPKRKMI